MKRRYQQPTITTYRFSCRTSFVAGSEGGRRPSKPSSSDDNQDIGSMIFGTTEVSNDNSSIL